MIPAFRLSGRLTLPKVGAGTPSPARSATERLPSPGGRGNRNGSGSALLIPLLPGEGKPRSGAGEGADREFESWTRLRGLVIARRLLAAGLSPLREEVHPAAEYRRDSRVGLGTFFGPIGDHWLLDEAADQAFE